MSDFPSPEVAACLRSLSTLSGVLWAGLCDRTCMDLVGMLPDGSSRPAGPAEAVLLEAITTAAAALSDRLGLGTPAEFEHRFTSGGLLILCPDSSRSLLLCHSPGAPVALLRLALRDAALLLPPPPASPGQPRDLASLDWQAPPADFTRSPDQSEVYNPFTSA